MPLATLRELKDWQLKDESQDIRGRTLRAYDGRPLGKIRNLMVNTDSERVEAVALEDGSEYPIRDIQLHDGGGDVFVTRPKRSEAPRAGASGEPAKPGEQTIRVPVIEEEVQVGKERVETGGVRITSEVKEKPVDQNVNLRKTEVHVDRRKTDRPATEEDFRKAGQSIDVRESEEQPVISKRAHVVEEIVVTKKVSERKEAVHDKARKTDVHVDDSGREGGPEQKGR